MWLIRLVWMARLPWLCKDGQLASLQAVCSVLLNLGCVTFKTGRSGAISGRGESIQTVR